MIESLNKDHLHLFIVSSIFPVFWSVFLSALTILPHLFRSCKLKFSPLNRSSDHGILLELCHEWCRFMWLCPCQNVCLISLLTFTPPFCLFCWTRKTWLGWFGIDSQNLGMFCQKHCFLTFACQSDPPAKLLPHRRTPDLNRILAKLRLHPLHDYEIKQLCIAE